MFENCQKIYILLLQGRIILAPFFRVNFADFWLAEQLTSLVPLFLDIHFFICFYINNTDWANGKC